MNIPHEISEELLARYLAKTATEQEIQQINLWLEISPLHKQELDAYQIIWQSAQTLSDKKSRFNADLAWNKMRQKMDIAETKGIEVPDFDNLTQPKIIEFEPTKRKIPVALWAAAVAALLVTAFGWFYFNQEKQPELLSVTTLKNVTETHLPDGTTVFLNYNSTLSYPAQFTGDLRSVSLKGEAFFDVKPDAAHPFVIDANGTEIKVLGTSFNVKAIDKEPVRVDVATGKVRVKKAGNEVNLVKGQSAEVMGDTVRSIMPDANIMGYRTQVFDFTATPLKDVVSYIREGYHADVRLSGEQLSKCRLTIRFEKEPLDATLSVIAETLELKLRKDGQTYWFEGEGCPSN